jgi:hypothetical protein
MWEHYAINTLILKATYIMSLLKIITIISLFTAWQKFEGNKFTASYTNPFWFSLHINKFQYHIKTQHQNFLQVFQTW